MNNTKYKPNNMTCASVRPWQDCIVQDNFKHHLVGYSVDYELQGESDLLLSAYILFQTYKCISYIILISYNAAIM